MTEDHRTYVERRFDGSYYFWCESDECYSPGPRMRYHTEAEAYAAASMHEDHPA